MSTLGNMGEREVIRRLLPALDGHEELIVGAGDDCAVCRMPGAEVDQVFTTDPIIEGVHFLAGEQPKRVGNKAAGRVLSDIAAMGATPKWLLVNVVAPAEFEMDYLEDVYVGMTALCRRFGAVIIGGDVARGPVFELHVFGVGELPAGTALLRSGARVGDVVFVTGPLGDSRAGKHLDFTPRIEEGIFLRESGRVNALMDLSDGLATDLRHVLGQSGVGADLRGAAIPKTGSLGRALRDGEDFELLLTAPPAASELLRVAWRARFGSELAAIGEVTDEVGVLRLDGRVFAPFAFEHFSAD